MKPAKKLLTVLVGGLLAGVLPEFALAQSNSYTIGSRTIFLAGCLTDEPGLNLQKENEVYARMRMCVCLLDKFQVAYTNTEFMTLFDQAERNNSAAKQELESFVAKHYPNCL